jgi:hypothetical protein
MRLGTRTRAEQTQECDTTRNKRTCSCALALLVWRHEQGLPGCETERYGLPTDPREPHPCPPTCQTAGVSSALSALRIRGSPEQSLGSVSGRL